MALTVACAGPRAAVVAPEAPREAVRPVAVEQKPPAARPSPLDGPVEVAEASVRSAAAERAILPRFGPLTRKPEELLLIDVRTQQPLGPLDRSALPVILLNERPVLNTIVLEQTRLVALVAVEEIRGREVTVGVTRLGDSSARSRNRFVLKTPP